MTITRLTSLPATITAGDTVAVTLTLADYPAPTWSLRWALAGTDAPADPFDSTDASDGVSHDFDLTTVDTAALSAGLYRWSIRATDGTTVTTVTTGTLSVLADIGSVTADREIERCERMLAAIRTAKENIVTGEIATMMVDGRQTVFQRLADLERLDAQYERQLARLQTGGPLPPIIVGRFARGGSNPWE